MDHSNIVIAHPGSNDKLESLKAFLKALKIKFEVSVEQPYNDEFVKMIKQGDDDIKNGKGKKITIDELDDLWK